MTALVQPNHPGQDFWTARFMWELVFSLFFYPWTAAGHYQSVSRRQMQRFPCQIGSNGSECPIADIQIWCRLG